MDKKRKLIIGGISTVVVAGGAIAAYQVTQTPENIFLSRLAANAESKDLGAEFSFTFDKFETELGEYDGILDGLEVKGNIHSNTESFDLSLNKFEVNDIQIPETHLIQVDDDIYLNADIIPKYIEIQASNTGVDIDTSETTSQFADKYVSVGELVKEFSGKDTYDDYQKIFEQSDKKDQALRAELQEVYKEFFTELDDDAYVKSDSDVTLTLENKDIKKFIELNLQTLVDSENYEGDKKDLKNYLEDFDNNYDDSFGELEEFEVSLTLGEKTGDLSAEISLEEKTDSAAEIVMSYDFDPIPYEKPSKPKKTLKISELKDSMEQIREDAIYSSYYDTYLEAYSEFDFTAEDVEQLEKEYNKDGLDTMEKAELDALKDLLSEKA